MMCLFASPNNELNYKTRFLPQGSQSTNGVILVDAWKEVSQMASTSNFVASRTSVTTHKTSVLLSP